MYQGQFLEAQNTLIDKRCQIDVENIFINQKLKQTKTNF